MTGWRRCSSASLIIGAMPSAPLKRRRLLFARVILGLIVFLPSCLLLLTACSRTLKTPPLDLTEPSPLVVMVPTYPRPDPVELQSVEFTAPDCAHTKGTQVCLTLPEYEQYLGNLIELHRYIDDVQSWGAQYEETYCTASLCRAPLHLAPVAPAQ